MAVTLDNHCCQQDLTRGDVAGGQTLDAAQAFASPWWIASHVFGLLALAAFAWLALGVSDLVGGPTAAVARWSGLAGAVLVLPYYGAETFGLHAVGVRTLAGDPTAFELVDSIRNQPVAITMFGIGLLSLALSGITTALAWQRSDLGSPSWAAWPVGIGMALLLPQFFVAPTGRMAFGIAYAIAAAVLIIAVMRRSMPSEALDRLSPSTGSSLRQAHPFDRLIPSTGSGNRSMR